MKIELKKMFVDDEVALAILCFFLSEHKAKRERNLH